MFSQSSLKYIEAEVNIPTASAAEVFVISCAKSRLKLWINNVLSVCFKFTLLHAKAISPGLGGQLQGVNCRFWFTHT